jgi:hypothetical protein
LEPFRIFLGGIEPGVTTRYSCLRLAIAGRLATG